MQPGADNRQTDDDCGHNTQTNTGKQVVRQGVTHEALCHGQQQEDGTDDPVSLTRLAECAGEEDAEHVRHDGHGEQESTPVVNLANEQATANLEGDLQGGLVGARHLDTVEWRVGTVVNDLRHRRVEEQSQVNTREEQDYEGVECNLTQQEGPVGREYLIELLTHAARQGVAVIHILSSGC